MKDKAFKKLAHYADNFELITTGQEIAEGYKPDAMLRSGNSHIIMECDTSTTRKGFVGGMVKAAKIHAHLQPYFNWIKPLTNLEAVYVIASDHYCITDRPLKLLDPDFMKVAKAIGRVVQ